MNIAGVTFRQSFFETNGSTLCVLSAGDKAAKPVVCVHGFPDTPHTFEHQISVLLEQGFRIVLPFLRGYPPSSTGKAIDYFPLRLAEDLLSVVDEYCGGKALLLGHDWGAMASYAAAHLSPEKIEKMLVAAVPPGGAFMRAGGDLKQAWRSRYAILFQFGSPMTAWMCKNNGQGIDWLWSYWSPSWHYSEKDIADVKHCLTQEGAMYAATEYYRQLFRGTIKDRSFMDALVAPIKVDTLLLQGRDDGCIGADFFDNLDEFFEASWQKTIIDGAGHFMHREKPEAFNQAMLSFFDSET